ncbi:MAG TPA: OmpA family protein [Candidatus Kapabacteria bacterium]|jgi:outer membrane protein OmpA-like peptidoglycan-associated protein|nr:OmpA family protein [Candidatus Kapabacteria bacterium]
MRILYLFFLFVLSSNIVMAQTPANDESVAEGFALSVRGGALLNSHVGNFSSFEGAADCATFTKGNGSGLIGSFGYELPLSSMVHFTLGLGLSNRSADLENTVTYPARDAQTLQTTSLTLANTLSASLSYLELNAEIRPTIFEKLLSGPLRALAGVRLYMPLSHSFTQSERIVSPANAVFLGDSRQQRAIASGAMPSRAQIGFGFSAGLENILTISRNIGLTQQITYDYNVTPVTNDAAWNISSLGFQLGLRFSFDKQIEKPVQIIEEVKLPEAPVIITKNEATPELGISIRSVRAKITSGNEVLSLPPLVNAVFFDQNSSDIPERYNTSPNFPSDELTFNALQYHTFLIASIVATVKNNPNAKIRLIGNSSGDDERGISLSEARALSVKQALVNAGVPENIIKTDAKVLPDNPSNQQYVTGREENRRVDIIMDNVPLKAYVSRRQYAEIKGDVIVGIKGNNMKSGTKLRLNGACLTPATVTMPTDSAKMSFQCRFDNNLINFPLEIKAASAFANASTAADVSLSDIPTENIDLNLENFNAVLRFAYDSRSLTAENKELLRQMANIIPAGSTVTILGGADATGGEDYNRKLSQDRAEATEKFIRTISGDKFTIITAVSTNKYPEDTPEGRFLNRNLQIKVSK